jgi:transposase
MTCTVDGPQAGVNVAGIDPHKKTLSVTVLDERGGVLGTRTFKVSGDGHRAMDAWAAEFGPVARWGVEGASALGRHTAVFLAEAGYDVRDVCPTRTAEQARRRRQGKTDVLDAERIAREVLADPHLPKAFKRAGDDVGPDPVADQIALCHKARRSILTSRQHLLNEAESIMIALPEHVQAVLGDHRDVRRRLDNLGLVDPADSTDPVVALRLRLLAATAVDVADLDRRDAEATKELAGLVAATGSTLDQLPGLATKSAAELIYQAGDARRLASPGSTGPPRSPRRQARATANRFVTGSTRAATAPSTPSCTGWLSPSSAATRRPASSTTTPEAAATPRRRRCESSSATSAKSSTAP